MKLLMLKNGPVENVLQTGLEVAIEERKFKDSIIVSQGNIIVMLQDHVVHRKGAGFVGAQHVHGAKVLDRIEPLDDDLHEFEHQPGEAADSLVERGWRGSIRNRAGHLAQVGIQAGLDDYR